MSTLPRIEGDGRATNESPYAMLVRSEDGVFGRDQKNKPYGA